MLHDPVKSLIWTQAEISAGILERIPQADVIGMFESVSENAGPEHSK